MGPLVRSTPAAVVKYGDYRPALRIDFWFACAYCSTCENEARGISFHIDHYEPQSRAPELACVYSNLYYACDKCNLKKGDLPEETERTKGYRFFRADADNWDDHFQLIGARVEHRSEEVGHYTVETLDLNRNGLREIRKIRDRLYQSAAATANGLRYLQGLKIDQLPPDTRRQFLEILGQLQEGAAATFAYVNAELVSELSHSELLEVDEEAAERTADRRAWLKQIRAQVPAAGAVSQAKSKAKKRKK